MKRVIFTLLTIMVACSVTHAKYSGGDSGVFGGRICADQSRQGRR